MLYKCDPGGNPRHLSVAVSSLANYSIEETYKWDIFGGICQITEDVFEKANGFPNHYRKMKISMWFRKHSFRNLKFSFFIGAGVEKTTTFNEG